jgi:WD40 repeat protein
MACRGKPAAEAESQANNAREQSYIANLAAADLYLRSNEIAAARQRLLSCPNDLRGWEWRHLLLKTDFSLGTLYYNSDPDTPSFYGATRPSHRQHQNLFAFSADGSRILSATQHSLYSWDSVSLLPIGRWNSLGSIIGASPHGNRILLQGNTKGGTEADHTLRIIDPASNRQLTIFNHHQSEIAVAEFSADGSRVATGDNRGGLFVWDTASGEIVSELTNGGSKAIAIALSPDGMIGAAFADKTVRLWSHGGRVRGPLVSLNNDDRLAAIAFSSDCKRLATAMDQDIRVWDAASGHRQLEVTDFEGRVRSVRFSPDGKTIVVGLDQGAVQIRSAESGSLLGTLIGNEYQVEAIGFHPDGRILTASSGKIRVWDANSFGGLRNIPSRASLIAFSPNGRVLVSAGGDSIQLWDASSGKAMGVLKTPLPYIRSIAFSPDGAYLACGSGDATIRILNIASQSLVKVLKLDAPADPPSGRIVLSVRFSPDGSLLASGSDDSIVRFWEVSTGIVLHKISVSDPVNALVFSPDGRRIVTGTGDPSQQQPLHASAVRVWDATSGQLLVSTKSPPDMPWLAKTKDGDFRGAMSVMYANDGGQIVSNGSYLIPIMWDASSGRLLFQFKTKTGFAGGVLLAIDPQGRRLFGGGAGVQIWGTRSGEPLYILRQPDHIWNLALSSDGTRLATASTEVVRIWNTESAYNLEAESLVQSLFAKLYFAHDVMEALRQDQKLDSKCREAALRLVQQVGDGGPQWHIQQAWQVAKVQGAARNALNLALRHAQLACDLAPWAWEAFNTLGAVQYRNGAYQDASTALLYAAELRGDPSVTNLAFRALTLMRLGMTKEARSALLEAKQLIDAPNTVFGPEVVAIVEEAGAALAAGK